MTLADLEARAREYAERYGLVIEKHLGHGNDGAVWQTTHSTAIKVCEDNQRYSTERDCYRLFRERGVTEIKGFAIPRLVNFSDDLMVIEMDVVQPPYIIDFGKAYLHRAPPHFSQQVMADWYAEKKELWGETWPLIQTILNRLKALGIYHMDPKPHNILPAEWDPPLD
jgi:hypothetical protein